MNFLRLHKISFIAFFIGLVIAALFIFIPSLHEIIIHIDRWGYVGIFIGGLMYGSALTASTATVIFVESQHSLNPIFVGLIGGLGAALYDTIVFLIVRREGNHGWLARFINRLREKFHVPSWVDMVLGGLIMASPLPDELASGLMGVTNGKTLPFITISFAANTIGVLILSRF